MKYRIQYSIWKINADSPEAAKKLVCSLLKSSPEAYISVEEDYGNASFLKRLWTGK